MTTPLAPRALGLIAQDMEWWADSGNADPETAHFQADKLLREAVERLAPYSTGTADEGEVANLLSAWDRVPKWYA